MKFSTEIEDSGLLYGQRYFDLYDSRNKNARIKLYRFLFGVLYYSLLS